MKTRTIEYYPVGRPVADVVADIEKRGGRVMFGDELLAGWLADANYHPVVVRIRSNPKAKEAHVAFLGRDQMENHILLGTVSWEEFLLPVRQYSLFRELEDWFDGEFAVAVIQN